MLDLPEARRRMVEYQLRARGVKDERVLAAMLATPREAFAPAHLAELAYEDSPLPIEAGQTISQPYIVAHMIEAAHLKPGDRVLEVGAGSGYAAAVMAAIAEKVFTIERHAALAGAADERLRALGYANVEVRIGDGSRGLPEAAPFDAILVAAAAPIAPQALKEQLAIGGRLVMPVGGRLRSQRLIKLTRASENVFEEEELGGVSFVPLIGAYGWQESEQGPGFAAPKQAPEPALATLIRQSAEKLPDFDDPAFGTLFGRFASARVILLGEAAEGTSEFQRARAAITRRLVVAHGFTIVAAAVDWDDAVPIDRFVNAAPGSHLQSTLNALLPKWRNADFVDFLEWMRSFNDASPPERRARFRGLDRYESNAAVHTILNAVEDGPSPWNRRTQHMFETLAQLLASRGPDAKAVVWAHNLHVGDARFTDMGLSGAASLGQLCREQLGEAAQLIGFGMHAGTAAAPDQWKGETNIVTIAPAHADSYEHAMRDAGVRRLLIDFREGVDDALRAALEAPRLERFIDPDPGADNSDRYARASLARQFDAYVWFDSSHAVAPLPPRRTAEASHSMPI